MMKKYIFITTPDQKNFCRNTFQLKTGESMEKKMVRIMERHDTDTFPRI